MGLITLEIASPAESWWGHAMCAGAAQPCTVDTGSPCVLWGGRCYREFALWTLY